MFAPCCLGGWIANCWLEVDIVNAEGLGVCNAPEVVERTCISR